MDGFQPLAQCGGVWERGDAPVDQGEQKEKGIVGWHV